MIRLGMPRGCRPDGFLPLDGILVKDVFVWRLVGAGL